MEKCFGQNAIPCVNSKHQWADMDGQVSGATEVGYQLPVLAASMENARSNKKRSENHKSN